MLERALEAAGVPYRLFPDRFESVGMFSAVGDPREETEVVVLKMHGSIDWFDKSSFIARREDALRQGYRSYVPSDPVFNRSIPHTLSRLVQGPRFPDDPLSEIYRVKEIEELYANPPWFRSTPVIINPSAMKLIYSSQVQQFWYGMNLFGAGNLRLAIIGYSLPDHDQYVRQAVYRIVKNFQRVPPERVRPYKCDKESLMVVDRKEKEDEIVDFKRRYSFVDWDKAELYLDGFSDEFITRL